MKGSYLRFPLTQGSKMVNNALFYQTWSEQPLIQARDDDDLHGGQWSTEVKCSRLHSMATKLKSEESLEKIRCASKWFILNNLKKKTQNLEFVNPQVCNLRTTHSSIPSSVLTNFVGWATLPQQGSNVGATNTFKGCRMGRSDKVPLWYAALLINTRFRFFYFRISNC